MSTLPETEDTTNQKSQDIIKAIAAFLLFTSHEGAGPHGRLQYVSAVSGSPIIVSDEE